MVMGNISKGCMRALWDDVEAEFFENVYRPLLKLLISDSCFEPLDVFLLLDVTFLTLCSRKKKSNVPEGLTARARGARRKSWRGRARGAAPGGGAG